MSKFKKGDKVRYFGPNNSMLKGGHVYTVNKCWRGSYGEGDFLRVEEGLSDCIDHSFHAYQFCLSDERQELSDAIDLLAKHKVIITGSQMTYEDSPSFTYTGLGSGLGTWTTKENLLERLFPTETPAQKKLKELEQQQLKIVAKMKELRNSMY